MTEVRVVAKRRSVSNEKSLANMKSRASTVLNTHNIAEKGACSVSRKAGQGLACSTTHKRNA